MQQSAITFDPQGVTRSPAYGRVSLTRENLIRGNLCGESGFNDPKTQNVEKIGENMLNEMISLKSLDSISYCSSFD